MAIEIRIQKNGGPEVMECHETKLNKLVIQLNRCCLNIYSQTSLKDPPNYVRVGSWNLKGFIFVWTKINGLDKNIWFGQRMGLARPSRQLVIFENSGNGKVQKQHPQRQSWGERLCFLIQFGQLLVRNIMLLYRSEVIYPTTLDPHLSVMDSPPLWGFPPLCWEFWRIWEFRNSQLLFHRAEEF